MAHMITTNHDWKMMLLLGNDDHTNHLGELVQTSEGPQVGMES